MKHLLLSACLTLTMLLPGALAKERPGMDVMRAAKLASDFLAGRGAGDTYIVSVAIDEGAIISGQPTWVAKWSRPIVSDGSTEVGVRVKGDGTIVRLVEGKGKTRSTRQPAALEIR